MLYVILPFFNEWTIQIEGDTDGFIISTTKDSSGETILFVYYYCQIVISFVRFSVHLSYLTIVTQQLLYFFSLITGFLLIVAELRILVQVLIPKRLWERFQILRKVLIPGTIQMEAKVKKACSHKMNRLIRNACVIHRNSIMGFAGESETTFGRALFSFSKSSDQREQLGGPIWMWKKLIRKEIFSEEGVWLTTHLLAGNLSQFTICLFIVSFFICE